MQRHGTWPWVVALAILSLMFGVLFGISVLIHITYLLVLLLLFSGLYVGLSIRFLSLEHRTTARRIEVGEQLLEVYLLRTRARWPTWAIDVLASSKVDRYPAHWALSLGARGHEELSHLSRATTRGCFAVGDATVYVTDPLGLFIGRRTYAATGEVIVWPQPRLVPDFTLATVRTGDLSSSARSWTTTPATGGVRAYAPGDPSMRIHWLSTMRHGVLMVKDSDNVVDQRLWIVVDTHEHGDALLEYGMEAAAYIADVAERAHLQVGLLLPGQTVTVAQPARDRDQHEHLRDCLARAQRGSTAVLPHMYDERLVHGSDSVVIITGRITDELCDVSVHLRRSGCGSAVVLLTTRLVEEEGDTRRFLEDERIAVYTLPVGRGSG